MKNGKLKIALADPIWINHKIDNLYKIVGDKRDWKIAYYPIFEDGKTKEEYDEPRFLMECKIENGIDFREIPSRYIQVA